MLFTLDIGSGTQDFLLIKEGNIRWPKMILPSPTQIVARKIRRARAGGRNIFLTGYTMGGGACVKAIKEHLNAGLKVYAEEKPALTISDNIESVKQMGVILSEPPLEENAVKIEMADVNMKFFENILNSMDEEMPDTAIVAVQDHGFSPHESNRRFRFAMFEKTLKNGYLHHFLFPASKIPESFNRMRSVAESVEDFCRERELKIDLYVIDTVFAAMAGCMLDAREFPALLLNFGNSHTVGAVVNESGLVYSLFEHHTSLMKKKGREGIKDFIRKFLEGKITNEDVFADGGHGAYIRDVVEVRDIVSTGPNVRLSSFRHVSGDAMVVGNLGMASLFERLKKGK